MTAGGARPQDGERPAAPGGVRWISVRLRGVQSTPRRVVVGRRPTPGRLPPPPCEAHSGRRSPRTRSTGHPLADGWFTTDPPRLVGTRCTACGTVCFPPRTLACPNPACDGEELVATPLSERGRIWSYTDARYRPPPPYVAADPFEPYAIAAVELAAERIIVLGQVVRGVGVDDLAVGMQVETVVEELDSGHPVWKWRPIPGAGEPAGPAGTEAGR